MALLILSVLLSLATVQLLLGLWPYFRQSNLRDQVAIWLLVWVAWNCLSILGVGLAGHLSWHPLLLRDVAALALVLFVYRERHIPVRRGACTLGRLRRLWSLIVSSPLRRWRTPKGLAVLCGWLVLALFLVSAFVLCIVATPLNYDSNTYRLSRIGYWLQEHAVVWCPGDETRMNETPWNTELLMTYVLVFFPVSFKGAALVQWLGGILMLLATARCGAILGVSRCWRLVLLLVTAGLPNATAQFFTTQTDLLTAGLLWTAIAHFLPFPSPRSVAHLWVSGIALATGLGTKVIVAFWGPGLCLAFTPLLLRFREWRSLRRSLVPLIVLCTALGLSPYIRNYVHYGNPIASPALINRAKPKSSGIGAFLRNGGVNIARYAWQNLDPSSNPPFVRSRIVFLFKAVDSDGMPESINSLNASVPLRKAKAWLERIPYNEDFLAFGMVPLSIITLILLSGGWTASVRSRRIAWGSRWLGPMLYPAICFAVLFPFVQIWTPHKYRYFVTLAPALAIGVVLTARSVRWQWLRVLLVACVTATSSFHLANISLLSYHHGWLRTARALRSGSPHPHDMRKLLANSTSPGDRIGIGLPVDTWIAPFFRSGRDVEVALLSLTEISKKGVSTVLDQYRLDHIVVSGGSSMKGEERFHVSFSQNGKYRVISRRHESTHKITYRVEGLYEDGWLSPDATLRTQASLLPSLHVQLSNPTPLPQEVHLSNEATNAVLQMAIGATRVVLLPSTPTGELRIQTKPGFRPSEHSATPDTRLLGVRMGPVEEGR